MYSVYGVKASAEMEEVVVFCLVSLLSLVNIPSQSSRLVPRCEYISDKRTY